MADILRHDLKQLLTLFQETWAERDAFRAMHKAEQAVAGSADWGNVFGACQTRAQELFQPALFGLNKGVPSPLVLEALLKRQKESRKPPAGQ
jgi:hypothetical protein